MNKAVLDTNILLETPEILERNDITYVISSTVLKELDDLKRKRGDLGFAVRIATRTILDNYDKIEFDFNDYTAAESNDQRIIQSAKNNGNVLYTEDILMTVIARNAGVSVKNPLSEAPKKKYTGYEELEVTHDMEDLIQAYYGRPAQMQKGFNAQVLERYIERPGPTEYVILNYEDSDKTDSLVFKYDAENDYYVKQHFSGKQLQINGHAIRPFDGYQHAALTSAINMNVPLTIIDGPVGSGKTLLALAAAMYLKNNLKLDKIYITRPPVGVDRRFDLGFFPGSIDEKLNPWIGGIISNLSLLYKQGSEQVFKDNFQHFPVNTAQGYSIHNSVLIVDESQLLPVDLTKQIISRVSRGSKLIMLGDENQSYKVVSLAEMGLRRLKKRLPDRRMEYVKLQKIYRGELAELSLDL